MMKKIIVAPLNWGLGHAARCVPIINSLLENKFTPVIASDGKAFHYLKKEFPKLETLALPSYNISYAKHLKRHLFFQIPKVRKAMILEKRIIEEFIAKNDNVVGVISDNRFGVRSTKVPSIYITHQINVLSGWTTCFTSYVHQRVIRQFDECWVPDEEGSVFSGKLSKQNKHIKAKYIGVLSRFKKEEKQIKYDVAVVLSGLEPHRSQIEKKLQKELTSFTGRVVFIRGIIEEDQKKELKENRTTYNYVLAEELQEILNTSEVIISRSGYSSIMDYSATEKKAILIPTPGQAEQEYLGKHLSKDGKVIFVNEDKFSIQHIEKAKASIGIKIKKRELNKKLFSLFQSK